jgi:hypothetical protein
MNVKDRTEYIVTVNVSSGGNSELLQVITGLQGIVSQLKKTELLI